MHSLDKKNSRKRLGYRIMLAPFLLFAALLFIWIIVGSIVAHQGPVALGIAAANYFVIPLLVLMVIVLPLCLIVGGIIVLTAKKL